MDRREFFKPRKKLERSFPEKNFRTLSGLDPYTGNWTRNEVQHLLKRVWGLHAGVETRTVDNFIMRLRKYIEKDPSHPAYLESVRGRGYRFNGKSTPEK